jgi:pyrimidine deaminase RibD-like protein
MHRARGLKTKQTLKLALSRGGSQKVVTPNNIRDSIGCVIHDDCEVVGPGTVCSP